MADDYSQMPIDRALNFLKSQYVTRVISPYTRAYVNAYNAYKKTLDNQAKANQRDLDLMLTAFSLVGGAYLTHVFGKAALKEVAKNAVTGVICNNNLERAFKVAAFVEGSETASFIVGKLWDESAKLLTDKTKEALKKNFVDIKSLHDKAKDPHIIKTHLQDFVEGCYQRCLLVVTDIENHASLSDKEKSAKIEQLKRGKFFSSLPKKKIDETGLAVDIELSFYMGIVLDLDYISHYRWQDMGRNFRKREYSRTSIPQSPRSKKYPTATRKSSMGGLSGTEIKYKSLGDQIADQINVLYAKKYPGQEFFERSGWEKFWGVDEATNRRTLIRAEQLLKKLGSESIQRLMKT